MDEFHGNKGYMSGLWPSPLRSRTFSDFYLGRTTTLETIHAMKVFKISVTSTIFMASILVETL
jgi:hypothetical protein